MPESRDRRGTRPQQLGLELVPCQDGSGVVVLCRRSHLGTPQFQFERVYDLPERVFPHSVLATPTPTPQESVTGLIRRAAQALGIASESCLRDYFRTRLAMTRQAIATLVERRADSSSGPGAAVGRGTCGIRRGAASSCCPRAAESLRLDDLRAGPMSACSTSPIGSRSCRAEARTRSTSTRFCWTKFVARVDLKADRARGVLRVNAAWIEHGCDSWDVATELASELKIMAEWLVYLQLWKSCREGTSHRPSPLPDGPVGLRSRAVARRWPTIGDALRHFYDG